MWWRERGFALINLKTEVKVCNLTTLFVNLQCVTQANTIMIIKAIRKFDGGFMNQFIKDNPTGYLSTHCPEGYENLEMKRVMKL